ncbi:MAG: MFS transporter [Gammaproteobacteria bacterium]|nr:MFS transporter [Gammaproteobacteria bacterium]
MNSILRRQGFLPFLVVLFLNAFVDLGHKIIIQNTVFKIYDGQTQIVLIAIVNALILLPFVLLFAPAGFLSDRFSKPKVMRISAWCAVILTLVITLCYYQGWYQVAFLMTLVLAIQSAFYSPSKYGYIKEVVGKEGLAMANGMVQATTIIAILTGIFAFSIAFEFYLDGHTITDEEMILKTIAPIGWGLVLCSIIELFFAYRLPEIVNGDSTQTFDRRSYFNGTYLRRNIDAIRHQRTIWLSIVGLSIFWGISQVALAAFPAFAKEILQETNTIIIQGILACSGIGIVIGSLLAGRASHHSIELGLIPIGAIGIMATLTLVPQLQSFESLAITFIIFGFFGGLFIVPLNSLIQLHASDEHRATIIAGNNWVQNLTMLSFLIMTVSFAFIGLKSIGLLYMIALIALIGSLYTIKLLARPMMIYLIGLLFRSIYHVDVQNLQHLPKQGSVLLLGNHISWLDWAIIQLVSPRPIRFVMDRHYYQRWYFKWFLNFFNVIPITPGQSKTALQKTNKALKAGEIACLFPEGTISHSGQLNSFKRGFEKTVDGVHGTIVPFYLHGLWGSRFSRSTKRQCELGRSGWRRRLIVSFGEAMPMTATADEVKQSVSDLSQPLGDQ